MFDHSVTISNELVSLEPMYLDRRILEHLRRKLKDSKVGTCTKEHGFIKEIEINKVLPSEISMCDGGTRFSVTYSVQSIMPKQGNVYMTKSVLVIKHNNVCCVISTIDDTFDNKFQIFIINGNTIDDKYKFNDCECSIPILGHQIDFVLSNIVVDTVEYRDKKFIVTGKHIHNYCHPKHDKEICVKTEEN